MMSVQRFTRARRCPICSGADSDPRGRSVRCHGFSSADGRYAHCSRIPYGPQGDGGTWAHKLAGECNCGTMHAEAPPSPPPTRPREVVVRDVPRIWSGLSLSDRLGEAYLESRGLWHDSLPRTGFFRFNTGNSCDSWVNDRAADGYRCALAVRRPDGTIQTIVFRHVGDGTSTYGKAPALAGCSTSGAAICRPEIPLLLEGDSEFEHDELELVEGPTDFLTSTLARDALYRDGLTRPSWTLGCIGAGRAVNVVKAFGKIIAGRVLRIALDKDDEGEKNARKAAEAAYCVGARQVLRCKPKGDVKDISELWKKVGT